MGKKNIFKFIQLCVLSTVTLFLLFEFDLTFKLLTLFIVPIYLILSLYLKQFSIIRSKLFLFIVLATNILYILNLISIFQFTLILSLSAIITVILDLFKSISLFDSKYVQIHATISFFIISYYFLNDQISLYIQLTYSIALSFIIFALKEKFQKYKLKTDIIFLTLAYFLIIQTQFFSFFEISEAYKFIFLALPIIIIVFTDLLVKKDFNYIQRFSSFILFAILAFSFYAMQDESVITESNWKKFATKTGNQSCMPCHEDITLSYQHSQMGRSMMKMTIDNLALDYDTVNVHDERNDYYYSIKKIDSSFFMIERRFNQKNEIIHELKFEIDYIVGSGNNTKSFLMVENDFVYEMPITYYSNKKKWDLSPGYRSYNIRFFREADQLCMDCHNAKNDFVEHSVNKFTNIPEGIDCEQCHGPASLHIENQKNQNFLAFDPIHNPENSEKTDLVCYDCHPRQILDNLSNDDKLEFTAHSTRLSMSKCFIEGDIKCMDCHDPHLALEETKSKIESSCFTCHNQSDVVKIIDHETYDNCTSCHMPKKGSSDIPHVNATDHFITVHDKDLETELKEHYQKFFRPRSASTADKKKAMELILLFRQKIGSADEPKAKLNKAVTLLEGQIYLESKYEYELAKAYFFQKRYAKAEKLFSELAENNQFEKTSDFYFLYATLLNNLKKRDLAKTNFINALKIYPDHIESLLSLSSIYLTEKDAKTAIDKVNKILSLIPFHERALYQKSYITHFYQNNRVKSDKIYGLLLKYYPDHYLGNINYANFLVQGEYFNEAIDRLKTLINRNIRGEQLEANLIRFYIMDKKKEKAEKAFLDFKKTYPSSVYVKAIQTMIKSNS